MSSLASDRFAVTLVVSLVLLLSIFMDSVQNSPDKVLELDYLQQN